MKSPAIYPVLIYSLLVSSMLVGCGGVDQQSVLEAANGTNLQRLTNLYLSYQSRNDWNGPPDQATLREFAVSFDKKKLARIGIDPSQIDELFVSERDGKPYKIRYNVKGSSRGSTEPVVFEEVGVSDKRRIGFLNMTEREVDAAEYDQLWAGN